MDKTAFSQAEKEIHARSLGKLSVGTAPSQIPAHTARNLRACYLGAVLSGCRPVWVPSYLGAVERPVGLTGPAGGSAPSRGSE